MVHICLIYWSYKINQVSMGASLKQIQGKCFSGSSLVHIFAPSFKVVPMCVCWTKWEMAGERGKGLARCTVLLPAHHIAHHTTTSSPHEGVRINSPTGFLRAGLPLFRTTSPAFWGSAPSGPGQPGLCHLPELSLKEMLIVKSTWRFIYFSSLILF